MHRSRAISAPVFPMPITKTDCPANGLAFTYSMLWMIFPANPSIPAMEGTTGSTFNPITITRWRATIKPDVVLIDHSFPARRTVRTGLPELRGLNRTSRRSPQIVNHHLSWYVAGIGWGEGNIWQSRELLDGMQVQALVSLAPRRTNLMVCFEDLEVHPHLPKTGADRKSCRTGANNDNFSGFGHLFSPLSLPGGSLRIFPTSQKGCVLGFYSVGSHVRFSNRPFGVKRFQTIRHCSVDVAREAH